MEKIVGSLVGVSYHTFDNIYDLLFTTERIIAFNIQNPGDTSYSFTSVLKDTFLGRMVTRRTEQSQQAKTIEGRRHSIEEKPINELVGLHPLNFEIRYSEVISVEITRGLLQSQLKFEVPKLSPGKQIISFILSKEQIPGTQRLLELVLSSKIKGK
jgi:hypothetical protein